MKRFWCKAILFDLDGVLVDSIASVERNWRKWSELNNLEAPVVLDVLHGRRAIDIIQIVAPRLHQEDALTQIEDLEVSDTIGTVATPGALSLLAHLPQQNWAVVTSGTRRLAQARMRAAELPTPRFLVAADDVTKGKPDPEGYLQGARMTNAQPTECIVIEDAVQGIRAAKAAGSTAIAVGQTYAPEELQEADAWIPTLTQVQVIIHDQETLPLEIILHDLT